MHPNDDIARVIMGGQRPMQPDHRHRCRGQRAANVVIINYDATA